MSFASPLPDVEIPSVSVYEFLFGQITLEDLEKSALINGNTGSAITYGELIRQVDAIAGSLSQRGLGLGDVVGLFSPNSPSFAAAFHGILRAGGTATTINALYNAHEIAKQLRDSKATFLMTAAELLPQAHIAAVAVGIPEANIIVLDAGPGNPGAKFVTLLNLIAEGRPAPEITFDPTTHIAVLPYSSGTTGNPKGVMLTHYNLVANVQQTQPLIKINRDDCLPAVLPLFHIYGLTVLLNSALHVRATLVTLSKFELSKFLQIIESCKCTYLFIAPPVALALAKQPSIDEYDLSSVRVVFSGAAPLGPDLALSVAQRLHCQVLQGFGMSELSPVSHATPLDVDDIAPGSVGLPVPNTVNKIVDPSSGEEIEVPSEGVSEPGELWVKGPNVMLGYLNNVTATEETLDEEGYLHTGDLATVDSCGVVTIVDRLKELIKYKGYQVPPAELETLLLRHTQIADAAVIGVFDEDGEEVPKAFVVKHSTASLTEQDVIDFVAAHVAPYKKVRQVEFISSVPKSAAGKILRRQLRV